MEYRVENDVTFKLRTQFFSNILQTEGYKNQVFFNREYLLDFKNRNKIAYSGIEKMTDERINDLMNLKGHKQISLHQIDKKSNIEELHLIKQRLNQASDNLQQARISIDKLGISDNAINHNKEQLEATSMNKFVNQASKSKILSKQAS